MNHQPNASGYLLALLAVFCFATGAVLLIWADPISAYEKTALRLLAATITMILLGVMNGNQFRYSMAEIRQFGVIGFVMAIHLLAFVASLNFTTIAHAMTITHTGAVFTMIYSALFLGESVPREKLGGVFVTLAGVAIMTGLEPTMDRRMMIGDGLALVTAATMGIYSVWGRAKRDAFPLYTYMVGVYGMATLWLLPVGWFHFAPETYTPGRLLAVLAAGVIPIGLGHTFFTAAVRRIHAAYVNLITTQAVTGSVLLGFLFLDQVPTVWTVVGGIIALFGVVIVLR